MKQKLFLTVLVLLFSCTLLHSQPSGKRVSFAFSLQPNVNWIHADESHLAGGPVRIGIEGGIRLDYRFEKFVAFSFGVNLDETGGNIIYNDALVLDLSKGRETLMPGTKVAYRLQFVEIPLAFRFILPEIGYTAWFAEIGVDPMFNTRAFINATDNNIEKEPFQQGIGKFNLAWHTGIGINYALRGRMSLQFGLMYTNTFLDVTRENEIRNADNVRINQIGLRTGIVF